MTAQQTTKITGQTETIWLQTGTLEAAYSCSSDSGIEISQEIKERFEALAQGVAFVGARITRDGALDWRLCVGEPHYYTSRTEIKVWFGDKEIVETYTGSIERKLELAMEEAIENAYDLIVPILDSKKQKIWRNIARSGKQCIQALKEGDYERATLIEERIEVYEAQRSRILEIKSFLYDWNRKHG